MAGVRYPPTRRGLQGGFANARKSPLISVNADSGLPNHPIDFAGNGFLRRGSAFDCWTPEEGLSRGYTYGRIEDAHYARNVEIRSRTNRGSDQTIACSSVDEFVRLTI